MAESRAARRAKKKKKKQEKECAPDAPGFKFSEFYALYCVTRTADEMMRDRGYEPSQPLSRGEPSQSLSSIWDLEVSEDKKVQLFCEKVEERRDDWKTLLSSQYEKRSGGKVTHRTWVMFDTTEATDGKVSKLSKEKVESAINYLDAKDGTERRVVILTQAEEASSEAKSLLVKTNNHVEVKTWLEMKNNNFTDRPGPDGRPRRHILVPRHEKLTPDELEQLKTRLDLEQLPGLRPDAVCRYWGFEQGDVLRITRRNPVEGSVYPEYFYYRRVL